VSCRQTFKDNLRDQLAADTESAAVARIRFYAANLSIVFGVMGLFAFLPMSLGEVSWAAAPDCLLMAAGGVLAAGVHRAPNVQRARRLSLLALLCTVVGFAGFFLVAWLHTGPPA
jgi:hypothetical protein